MNNSFELKKRYGTCSKDCYGSCVFIGEWNDQAPEKKLIIAKPLKEHPFTRGFFCPKLNNREKMLYHSQRIKNPLIRTGVKGKNSFTSVSLEEALNLISTQLTTIKEKYKPSSIIAAYYAGNSGLISMYSSFRFFRKLGATITSEGTCNEAGCFALERMFGNYSTTNPFQIANPNNRLIVVWGSNLADRNNHAYFLVKKAIRNGSKLIVVNPVRTKLAECADLVLQPFPGTDFLIAKYVLNKLVNSGTYDQNFLSQHVNNYTNLVDKVEKIDEDKIFHLTGLNSENLHEFLNLLIDNKQRTLFIAGFGPQKYFYGGRNLNSIALIQVFLGNFGYQGSGFLFSQSGFNRDFKGPIIDYITNSDQISQSRRIPLINLGSSLHSNQYKMLFVYNVNPVSSLPNQSILEKSLLREDLYTVVLDMFLNETTKFADIVIPVKFDLETDDLITPYFIPGISINQGGPCPYPECSSNYEFFQQLAGKIGWNDNSIFQETQEDIFKKCCGLLPKVIQEDLRTKGYYIPFDFNDVPFNNSIFPTSNGKIQIHQPDIEIFNQNLDILLQRKEDEFYLLSQAHKYFIHSQIGPLHEEYSSIFGTIFINPMDVKSLCLTPDQKVLVSNKYGEAKYILGENSDLKPGTALIYSGIPFAHTDYKNVNIFTPEMSEESGLSGAYFSTIVRITKI
ncbi:MAG: molybdopterin-dependent oxidoreductase [Candidatus Lokiarchaeota archaeon]|nr:molybdopterin-dependent oxidoreductase [Candidatus Lokiarchaeota archaeon]